MQAPQFLLDLLQLLLDLAVPAAFCTLAAAGVSLRHEGGINFHVNGRTGKWILWTIVLLTLPQHLTLGLAMTDAKGDRSLRAGGQANPDVYVRIKERRPDGVMIRGTKAIITGAPCMHGFLVMPCRTHTRRTPTSPSAAPCRSTRLG